MGRSAIVVAVCLMILGVNKAQLDVVENIAGGLVGEILDGTKNLVDGVVGAVTGDSEVPIVGEAGSRRDRIVQTVTSVTGGTVPIVGGSSGLDGITGTVTSVTGGTLPIVGGSSGLDGVLGTVGSVNGAGDLVTGVVEKLPIGDITSVGPVLESLGAVGSGVGNAVTSRATKLTLRTLIRLIVLRRLGLLG